MFYRLTTLLHNYENSYFKTVIMILRIPFLTFGLILIKFALLTYYLIYV